MRNAKRVLSVALALTLAVSMPVSADAAKKKPKLNKTKVTLKVGKTVKLKVKNNKKKVKWSSSKKKVATVKNGKVKAKKVGKTVITAKVGKKKLTCKVTVKKNTTSKKKNNNTTPNVPVVTPVTIASVSVVNASTIHVTLSSEQELSKDKFTVKKKSFANGTYNRDVKVESVTTSDKKTYVIKVNAKDDSISLNQYVQVTVTGLTVTGTASSETVFTKVSQYTDSSTYISRVGASVDRTIYMEDTYGYVKVSSVEVTNGLTYTIDEKNECVYITGKIQQVGITTAVVRYVDELGNTYESTRRWLAGDDKTLVAYNEPGYGVALDGKTTYISGNFFIAGGSGEYSCRVTDPSTGTSVYASVYEDEGYYGQMSGEFGAGKADVKIEITDAYDFAVTTSLVWSVDVKTGKKMYVKLKDAKGNDMNISTYEDAYFNVTNEDPNEKYCRSSWSNRDENGMYAVVADGSYEVRCYANGTSQYYYGVKVAGNDVTLDVNLPVYPVTLTCDNLDLSSVSWYAWDDYEEDTYTVGQGNLVYLEEKDRFYGSTTINNVYYKLEGIFTDVANSTAAVSIVTQVNLDGGTITLDNPIDTTLADVRVYYKFVPETSGIYCFSTESSADTYGYLCDSSKTTIRSNDDAGVGANFMIIDELEAGETYYIAMRSYGNSDDGASVKLSVREATQEELDDYEDEYYDEE